MNKKIYWEFRKKILRIVFRAKEVFYRTIALYDRNNEHKTIVKAVFKYSTFGMLKGVALAAIALKLDYTLANNFKIPDVSEEWFVSSIIGGIGVAGVILALFCSNIATIYSSRYSNAPRIISDAFQHDRLIGRCISRIIDYIILSFIFLMLAVLKVDIGWAMVAIFIVFSVAVIVMYSVAGNRTYQLSDVYRVSDDVYLYLYYVINKRLNMDLWADDPSFQNHFMKIAEDKIKLLKAIQKFGSNVNQNDFTTMVEFMCNNLALMEAYWMEKPYLSKESMWFRNTPKYQKWHLSSDIESSLALRNGTALGSKEERNYWWFEEELLLTNKACVNQLFEREDFESLYTYYLRFDEMCATAIRSNEASYYVANIDWLKQMVEKRSSINISNKENLKKYAGLVDAVVVLYHSLILKATDIYKNFDFKLKDASIIKAIDEGYYGTKLLRGRNNLDWINSIITEIRVEGKRITPDWVVKQQIAKEEFDYLNLLVDVIREGLSSVLNFGKSFLKKEMYFEACVVFVRFYAYESNLTRFVEVVRQREVELDGYHVDKELTWDDFRLEKLLAMMSNIKKEIPTLLTNSACEFTLKNSFDSDQFPDFLGESFNHICEDAVDSIINNDNGQFEVDYENLSKLMLLYQEYIRQDFVKKENLYRAEYAYYMFTSPIAEWAQIGGLAILWGEFKDDTRWNNTVKNCADIIFAQDEEGVSDLPEKLIELVQRRQLFMQGNASRYMLESGWKQTVASAIKDKCKYEEKLGIYGHTLKTISKLLNSFCPNFIDFGFTYDPSEAFWVMCVNPKLPEEKRFQTSNSWDKELQND